MPPAVLRGGQFNMRDDSKQELETNKSLSTILSRLRQHKNIWASVSSWPKPDTI